MKKRKPPIELVLRAAAYRQSSVAGAGAADDVSFWTETGDDIVCEDATTRILLETA